MAKDVPAAMTPAAAVTRHVEWLEFALAAARDEETRRRERLGRATDKNREKRTVRLAEVTAEVRELAALVQGLKGLQTKRPTASKPAATRRRKASSAAKRTTTRKPAAVSAPPAAAAAAAPKATSAAKPKTTRTTRPKTSTAKPAATRGAAKPAATGTAKPAARAAKPTATGAANSATRRRGSRPSSPS
jgi:hypothetical protein